MTRVHSDDRLARRAAKGDERAFAAIFRRYDQSLYRFCLAILGDSQDAQDALQNTMVKALRALPGEERKIELKPWLYRIAHNESIELLRRRPETQRLDPELTAPGAGLAEETALRERLRQLIADLDQLPERQRAALVMRELAGLDFGEIGAALSTSPAVARQTLYEARLSLRQMDEGREMSCEAVTRALSDGDGRVSRRRDLRAHLRSCAGCRRFREEIDGRELDLAALSPLPAAATAGVLQGLLGAGHGAGGGVAGALGGGAAKSIGASAALKGAAAVAVVAAIGVTAADRGGLIQAGLPGDGGSQATPAQPVSAGGGEARPIHSTDSTAAAGAAGGSTAGGHLGASHAAKATGRQAAGPEGGETDAEATSAPGSKGSSVVHPRGRGHQKEHPSASAHGQETAAAHKAVHQGSAGVKAHAAHPSKASHPAHPAPPSNPGSGSGTAPPSQGGAEHQSLPHPTPEP